MDSETRETLTASYNEIAELLDLPEKDVREQKRIVEAVKRWLRIHQNYLLIFDNANTPAFLNFFLPSDPTGHLLITTRSAHANEAGLGLTESLAIGVLTPELGAQLLLRRSGRLALATSEELVQAAALADELGGLPLALDQAGAYMASRQINSESYHELYQRHHLKLLKERYNKWEHPEAVITTWNISFQAVEQQNVAAAELLRFCAFLAPEEISKEILTKGTSVLGPVLAPVSADELSLDEAIEILREYSLVDRNGVKKTIKVHRLVQAVVRENMPNREKKIWEKRVIGAIQAAFPRPDFANWATCEYILPHAQLCMDWIQQSRLFSGAAANLLTQAGAYLQYRGRYTEAELMLERALAIRKMVLGANHAGTASSLNNLATLYQAQGRYSEAEPLYTRSLVIRERELGANHPETTDSLCNLAGLYCMQGNYSKAEPLLVRALAAFEQSSEINYPHKAHSLSNLGLLYQEQGKYSQAEPLLVQALATFEQELGADHPETAGGLKNLGSFYQEQGRYDEAEPLLLRALAIYERELSTNHPMTASSLNSLSTLYQKQGRYDEAEPLLVRTMAIYEREPDTDYIHIVTSLNNLGLLYQKQGRLPEAEALLVRAKTLSEQELGSSHPHTATSLSSLAGLYATRGKYAEAELLYQQALRIYESERGPKHPNAAQVMNNLAGLYHTQGHVAEAERLYILALASYALAFGRKKPPSIHIIGENYANLLREQGREEEARQVERSILGTVHT